MAKKSVSVLVLLFAAACASAHSPITRYQLNNVEDVMVAGNLNLVLSGGVNDALSIEQPSQPGLQVKALMRGNHLLLCNSVGCAHPHHGYVGYRHQQNKNADLATVHLTLAHLKKFGFNGTGTVSGTGLKGQAVSLRINNAGQTTLSGHKLNVRHIENDGPGRLSVHNLMTNDLQVKLKGAGLVDLYGIANLKHLLFEGAGRLNMYWLSSCHLDVTGRGQASAFIAGVADVVHADLTRHAYLNARYLRSKTMVARTKNTAHADVWSSDALHARADDDSSIFFFKRPLSRSIYMYGGGAVFEAANSVDNCPKGLVEKGQKDVCAAYSIYNL